MIPPGPDSFGPESESSWPSAFKFLFRDSNAHSPGQLAIHCIAPGGYFIAEGTVADHFRAGDGLGR